MSFVLALLTTLDTDEAVVIFRCVKETLLAVPDLCHLFGLNLLLELVSFNLLLEPAPCSASVMKLFSSVVRLHMPPQSSCSAFSTGDKIALLTMNSLQ